MRRRKVAPEVVARLAGHPKTLFNSQMAWYDHLVRLPLDVFDRTLVQEVSEAALWGAVRHHGLMENTVVVSDSAGQFRIANYALCWVHAERLLQKLMPKVPHWKLTSTKADRPILAKRFDDIFGQRSDYQDLDQLLVRLHRRKDELLMVLERPEIPLHTNASENDLRACVTKRRVSGGTMTSCWG